MSAPTHAPATNLDPQPQLAPGRPRRIRRRLAAGLSSPHHLHLSATLISLVVSTMLLVAVLQSHGDWENARMAALIAYNLLGVIAGTVFYVVWRLNGSRAAGWLAVAVLSVALSELPFMLMGFIDHPARVPDGGEFQEVVAVWAVCGFLWLARHEVGFGDLSPFTWAVAVGVALGLLRTLGVETGEGTLDAASPLGIGQRLVLLVGLVLALRNLLELDLPRRVRLAMVVVFVSTGLFALTDTGVDEVPAAGVTAFTLVYLMVLAELQLEGGLWLTLRALGRRQHEMTQLAVRAAAAEALVAREGAVLDAVRSTVLPLAHASEMLQQGTTLPERQRGLLADAMRREIDRINRTLGGDGTEPRAFGVDEVIGPLAEFHRAQGRDVVWAPSGLTVVHDPDTVARAVGVSLSTVAAGAPQSAVVVRALAPRGLNGAMTVQVFPHGLPGQALRSVFLQEQLARFGTGPSPESVSLRSVERLLQSHGGGLRVLVPEGSVPASAGEPFGLELSLPFRANGRNLPIPR